MSERILGILVGTWLVISAFAWRHTPVQMANAVACGGLAVVLALVSVYWERARYLAGLLSVWIFFAALFTLRLREMTLWNNAVCAIALFLCSLVGDGRLESGRRVRRRRAMGHQPSA
jgi:hypothetical protein